MRPGEPIAAGETEEVTCGRLLRALPLVIVLTFAAASCGSDQSSGPGFTPDGNIVEATFDFTIPLGAGDALDAGEPLEILPAELNVTVGETIRIVNDDDRGHNIGPWFVGPEETLTQQFSSPGEFEGVCTVHPSGQLVLVVSEA